MTGPGFLELDVLGDRLAGEDLDAFDLGLVVTDEGSRTATVPAGMLLMK